MQSTEAEFKTLLSKEEYDRLYAKFKNNHVDYQTNHYLDTPRFTLKACKASLRVRERDVFTLTLKRSKEYGGIHENSLQITKEMFEEIKETGCLPDGSLNNEVMNIIGTQKLVNFMSLSTKRLFFYYGSGILFIDKSTYLGITDYELVYEAKNYQDGKKEFIQLLVDLNVKYKRSEKKIKRAYDALKEL